MSETMRVIGIRPATEDYKKKLAAYAACHDAGVPPPKELSDYFEDIHPKHIEANGMEVDVGPALQDYRGEDEEGVEFDLDKLPEGVRRIRVILSY